MRSGRLLGGTAAAVCALLAACVAPDEGGEGLGFRVSTLGASGPQEGLPPEADTLRILVMAGDEVLRDFSRSVVGLDDLDGNGSDDREAVVPIPPDRDVSVTVFAAKNVQTLATARADGIRVKNGGRRYVDLTFTPVRDVSTAPQPLPSGRFGHASALAGADGRVLVTGGFTVTAVVDCAGALGGAEVCFRLEATDEALLIDPASGAVYETRARMLSRRALHTATSLPDGRVLVAGGVDAAILGLYRLQNVGGDRIELHPRFVPLETEGFQGALRSFEIFDPTLNGEERDVGRDGDPQAGGFVGTPAEPSVPGSMNTARFLHAATPLPGDPSPGVLIVGGQGSADAPLTSESFVDRRPGGSGFGYPPMAFSTLAVERAWPAAGTGTNVVLVMGGAADLDRSDQTGDRWLPGTETGEGTFVGLTECSGWTPADRPNNALVGGVSAVFGHDVQRLLVAGWLGPLCEPDSATPESYSGSSPCAQTTYANRSFTVGLDDCTFGRLQDAGEHFLGAAGAMPNGGAVLAGGFSTGLLSVTDRVIVFTGAFNASTQLAERDVGLDVRLGRGRAWLTATTLMGGRVLFAGGMNFVYDGGSSVPTDLQLSPVVELYDPGWDPSEAAASGEGEL